MTRAPEAVSVALPAAVFLATCTVFVGSVTDALFWDDYFLLSASESLKSGWQAFSSHSLGLSGDAEQVNFWRPLTTLSYYLQQQLSPRVAGQAHAVNVACHGANAVLCFFWLKRWLGPSLPSGLPFLPALAAFLWATVPIKAEAVGWISGRPDVLGAFMVLLGSELIARTRGIAQVLVATLFTVLSLLTKETMVAAPAFFVLEATGGVRGKAWIRSPVLYVTAALVAAYLAYRFFVIGIGGQYSGYLQAMNFADRTALFVESIAYAARGLSFPFYSTLLSGVIAFQSKQHLQVEPLMGVGGFVLLLLFALFWLKLRDYRPFLLVTAAPLLPVLNLVPTGLEARMCDRYLYLPLLGVIGGLLAGALRSGAGRLPWVTWVLVALNVVSAALGAYRAWLFGHPERLMAFEAEHGSRPISLMFSAAEMATDAGELVAARDRYLLTSTRVADLNLNRGEELAVLAARVQLELTGEQYREAHRAFAQFLTCALHPQKVRGEPVMTIAFVPGPDGVLLPCTQEQMRRFARNNVILLESMRVTMRARLGQDVASEVERLSRACPGCFHERAELGLAALALGRPDWVDRIVADTDAPRFQRLRRTAHYQRQVLAVGETAVHKAAVAFLGLAPVVACRTLRAEADTLRGRPGVDELQRIACTMAGSAGEPLFTAGSQPAIELRSDPKARYQLIQSVFPELPDKT